MYSVQLYQIGDRWMEQTLVSDKRLLMHMVMTKNDTNELLTRTRMHTSSMRTDRGSGHLKGCIHAVQQGEGVDIGRGFHPGCTPRKQNDTRL